MPRPAVALPESHVETACPLDCPDACSLDVTLRGGRIVKIEGSRRNEVTRGYICGKVRHFQQRVYGDDRLLFPALRNGAKGGGTFRRYTWDEALDLIADKIRAVRDQFGGEAILPLCYGGSNGLLTQDTTDAMLFRRLSASRLLRTLCAAPTGAANQGLYGKMPSVTYADYPQAKLIVLWGVNPSKSGIHIVPFLKEARSRGAKLVVVDPRMTSLARQADLYLPVRPGTDVVVALAIHRFLFEEGKADMEFLRQHSDGSEQLRERAQPWTFERAAEISGVTAETMRAFAELFAASSPAVVKCGWGLERNRNGGSAAAAVLALPAVGGKFGVRGGGYSMSNSASWDIDKKWLESDPEPATRAVNMNQVGRVLTGEAGDGPTPPIKLLFVYNCNPAVTLPDQNRVLKGLQRDDLFTIVFDQVFTDTAQYADIVLPATTFLEHYDTAKAYGPLMMEMTRPVIDEVGESRANAPVFAALLQRLGLDRPEDPSDDLENMFQVLSGLPGTVGDELKNRGVATPPYGGQPIQFVDVFPRTPNGKVQLCPEALDRQAPLGLYGFQPDPATRAFPLALISPATERTISSTLGELPRPQVRLDLHPDDAAARQIEDGDPIRIFNELGEVKVHARVSHFIRRGTVSMPKGVWRRHTTNHLTSNALVPDSLADLGGGACFNDARVEVERIETDRSVRQM
jgi:anaerobic selenocysteine-containing dehydrogenase